MARPKRMSKTTFVGICLSVPAILFTIMFLLNKMTETGYIGGLGALATFGPVLQGYFAKDDDKIDYNAEIQTLKEQIEQLKNKS